MKYSLIAIVLVAIMGVGIYAFSEASKESKQDVVQAPVVDEQEQDTAIDVFAEEEVGDIEIIYENPGDRANSFRIIMSNYSFAPSVIEVMPGEEVTINLYNEEGIHDFIIDEFDVHSEHADVAGQELSVTFIVPEDASGAYEFYCSVGDHRERGMVGTLQVVDK